VIRTARVTVLGLARNNWGATTSPKFGIFTKPPIPEIPISAKMPPINERELGRFIFEVTTSSLCLGYLTLRASASLYLGIPMTH
jgi:hypothetical protein